MMKNTAKLLVKILGIILVFATITAITTAAAGEEGFQLKTGKNVLVADENTAMITTFEQDPESKMITATVQFQNNGAQDIKIDIIGIAIYFDGNRVAPYSFNATEPERFTGRISADEYKNNLSQVFGAYFTKHQESGFRYESNQLIQNEPGSEVYPDSFINIILNHTNSKNELAERIIEAGEKIDVATFYFMPVNENDSKLDLNMFKFKFSRDYANFIRVTNFLGNGTYMLEASSVGIDFKKYTVALNAQAFRIHAKHLPPDVEADNVARQIKNYDSNTMQWSYDGVTYNEGAPVVKNKSHSIYVRVVGDENYGGDDGLYKKYKMYLASTPTIVDFEENPVKSEEPGVNPVSKEDTEITGTGEPGAVITVTFPDGETKVETEVDEDGNWTVEVPDDVTLRPGDKIEVVQTEDDKYPSDPVIVEVEQDPEPEKSESPEVDPVTEGDKEITGTGTPGSEIIVTFPDGSTETGIVDDDGNWTVEIPGDVTLEPGDEIKVVQVEEGKGPSDPVVVEVGEKDADPEKSGKPAVNPVTEGDKEITGTGEPGSEITVTFPDGSTETTIVDDDGNWTVEVPGDVTLEPGDEIEVVQTEDDKDPSDPVIVVVREKSDSPTVNPVTEGDNEITGTGVPGADIVVTFPDGSKETAIVDVDGNWTVEVPGDVTLESGDEIKVVQIEDGKGPSDPVIVTVEEKDDGGEPEKSSQPEVDPVTEGDKEITGTGEPGSEIVVTFPDESTETTIVDDDGNWMVEVPGDLTLEPGDEIEVVQIEDGKGPSDPVIVTVDEKEDEDDGKSHKPGVNPVTEGDKEITGTGEPGSEITVTFPDGSTETAIVDDDGNWTVEVPDDVTLEAGDEIEVVQIEDGKEPSDPVIVKVDEKGAEKPEKPERPSRPSKSDRPEIDRVTEGDARITGAGVPGAKIIVSFPGGKTGEATVGQSGAWSVDVPNGVSLEPGDTITARQTESNKRPSDDVTVAVRVRPESKPPKVDPVTEGDKDITGTGEPGSVITVTFPDGETKTGVVNGDGSWKVTIPDEIKLKPGDVITVAQTEDGKKPSGQIKITVGARVRPSTPKGTTVIDNVEVPLSYLERGEHRKYIIGYTDKTVRADRSITRAEVAMIFYRLLQNKYQGGSDGPSFNDVPNGAWFTQAIKTLAKLGVIQGYADGTFRPNDPITRAEFTAVAARFSELEHVDDVVFSDVPTSHWAAESIESAYAKGWVEGYDDGEFRPEQNITRAEVTKIIDTMLRRLPAVLPENLVNPYSDINSTHAAFINIMEASTEHTYMRDGNGIESWLTHVNPINGENLVNTVGSELGQARSASDTY